MKRHMGDHVENTKSDMFTESIEAVKTKLTHVCRQVSKEMAAKAEEVLGLHEP
jgi:hypothetical protein